jgi:hypothetical protein
MMKFFKEIISFLASHVGKETNEDHDKDRENSGSFADEYKSWPKITKTNKATLIGST